VTERYPEKSGAHEVNSSHINSDVDTGALSQHHTLGKGPTQAAPGNHVHSYVDLPDNLTNPIRAKVTTSVAITTTTGVEKTIDWDASDYDVGDLWVIGSPSKLTVPEDGLYVLFAQIAFAANATGYRQIFIRNQGGSVISHSRHATPVTGVGATITTYTEFELAAGDWFAVSAQQNSGGNLNVLGGSSGLSSHFIIRKVAPIVS